MRVLLIEDDDQIAGQAVDGLSAAGFTVRRRANGADGCAAAAGGGFDAIVLDLGLPDMDGLQVLERLRHEPSSTPVLILSARGGWMERVDGLNAGADDYLTKPFQVEELIARLNALLRRSGAGRDNPEPRQAFTFDREKREVQHRGKRVALSPNEFKAIDYFVQHRGRIVSPEELISHLHGDDQTITTNSVEALIRRLRRKLGESVIETRRGFGYVLSDG